MKKLFLLLPVMAFSISTASAQERSGSDPQNMKVTTTREPYYAKGEQALYNEVLMGIKYSDEAKKKYLEGEVMMSFDVLADSTVSNVKIISDPGYGVGDEVKNYVLKLKFVPALQMNKPVKMKVMMNFPIKAH